MVVAKLATCTAYRHFRFLSAGILFQQYPYVYKIIMRSFDVIWFILNEVKRSNGNKENKTHGGISQRSLP